MSTRKGRFLRRVLITSIIVVPLGLICLLGYLSWSIGWDAQHTLNAYTLVLDVLAEYLQKNNGRWPRSWDDLVIIRHPGYWPFQWPHDVGEIRRRVQINFDESTADVISSDVANFTAVCKGSRIMALTSGAYAIFLEAARRSVGRVPEGEDSKRQPAMIYSRVAAGASSETLPVLAFAGRVAVGVTPRLPQIRACAKVAHLVRHVVEDRCPSHDWVVSR